MRLSEGQIKDVLALKENLFEQIERHQEGIKMLEQNITVLDLFLKGSSFTKASELGTQREAETATASKDAEVAEEPPAEDATSIIKRPGDGKIVARVYVTAEQIVIVLDDEIRINVNTPPLRTFFLDRIIGDMKKKDSIDAENQRIQKESMIDGTVKRDDEDNIKEIVIKNYRLNDRVSEITKTIEWTLMRMLEKVGR